MHLTRSDCVAIIRCGCVKLIFLQIRLKIGRRFYHRFELCSGSYKAVFMKRVIEPCSPMVRFGFNSGQGSHDTADMYSTSTAWQSRVHSKVCLLTHAW